MKIAIDCDHAGFPLVDVAARVVRSLGHRLLRLAPRRPVPGDDYPDSAARLAGALRAGRADRGVLICGSGVGAAVAVNKFPGIRAALCGDTFSAHQGVEDDDANVLCLGARVTGPNLAADIVRAFLKARFSGAVRHRRRVNKIAAIERRFAR